MVKYTLLLFLFILLEGCNTPWGLPEATQKDVLPSNISGIWQFHNTTLKLCPDKTFTVTGSVNYNGVGTWSIAAKDKLLDLTYDQSGSRIIGYIVDSGREDVGIFGGDASDPDAWQIMEKKSSTCTD